MDRARNRFVGLSEADVYEFVRDLAEARWGTEWTVDVSPPSPGGGIDVTLDREGARRLVHVRQYPATSEVGALDVEEVARLRERRPVEAVAFATTSAFSPAAREAARDRNVSLVGPADLLDWADEAGVVLPDPDPSAAPPSAADLAERYVAYWPEALRERAREVVVALDRLADFAYETHRGDASTELRCRASGEAVALVRFTETSFLVFARLPDGEYEPVVRLTAFREHQPPLDGLLADLEPAIERALEAAG